jgi:hypothetical protein
MGWEHVLFANWPVEPEIVESHLPEGLTADTYDGQAWLSVVPFTNVDVRPTFLPDGLGLPLPELNLRTYVEREGESTPGNAVYFFSLDADGVLGVSGARLFHHLPYFYADIDMRVDGSAVAFDSRRRHPGARPAPFSARYEPTGEQFSAESGSLESFLTDRDRYVTETPGGELRYATVRHEKWPLYEANVEIRRNGLFTANGFAHPETEPVHLYSPRVTTIASESQRL